MRYAFAGDRKISCDILNILINKGFNPSALMVTDGETSSHSDELIQISKLSDSLILKGKKDLNDLEKLRLLENLDLDYIIGIHYPYIISSQLLNIPKIGFLNLHPAYLPYNKGWNTPSWAIMDKTDYGATLHFMTEALDKGDIIHQKKLEVAPNDTANTLYQKALDLEKEVFTEALEDIVSLNPPRSVQKEEGTSYKKKDLEKIREFDLEERVIVKDFLDKLRALSTNSNDELAYFNDSNKKIGVKIEFFNLD
ncbi:hypothetical protein C1637_22255 [Chryseobacterium lactis]|uniref:Formyl transferase N-terminal domain-containing protein n=1 Tax=Chryseobacterium lactis TaxID=1241981 RepID=A0A3G6RNI9_CHRLC|nr:formyltransferase family protein [Chryseobacterium lactis]AZA85005.1 hypothetical protein EG342_25215 [Chryseobacterium lactis]AZB05393.1 hypothetical protein EG341_16095 [Chryseobacterium lactis]PNW11542.1 hypothetical protein C1637_22255 [Chryseobacterium lactis]